jgi:hypothetical protein
LIAIECQERLGNKQGAACSQFIVNRSSNPMTSSLAIRDVTVSPANLPDDRKSDLTSFVRRLRFRTLLVQQCDIFARPPGNDALASRLVDSAGGSTAIERHSVPQDVGHVLDFGLRSNSLSVETIKMSDVLLAVQTLGRLDVFRRYSKLQKDGSSWHLERSILSSEAVMQELVVYNDTIVGIDPATACLSIYDRTGPVPSIDPSCTDACKHGKGDRTLAFNGKTAVYTTSSWLSNSSQTFIVYDIATMTSLSFEMARMPDSTLTMDLNSTTLVVLHTQTTPYSAMYVSYCPLPLHNCTIPSRLTFRPEMQADRIRVSGKQQLFISAAGTNAVKPAGTTNMYWGSSQGAIVAVHDVHYACVRVNHLAPTTIDLDASAKLTTSVFFKGPGINATRVAKLPTAVSSTQVAVAYPSSNGDFIVVHTLSSGCVAAVFDALGDVTLSKDCDMYGIVVPKTSTSGSIIQSPSTTTTMISTTISTASIKTPMTQTQHGRTTSSTAAPTATIPPTAHALTTSAAKRSSTLRTPSTTHINTTAPPLTFKDASIVAASASASAALLICFALVLYICYRLRKTRRQASQQLIEEVSFRTSG